MMPLTTALAFLVGLALINIGGLGIFKFFVYPNLVLEPGSFVYPSWVDFPVPVYTSVYFFNVTNSEEILDTGAKPILQVRNCFFSLLEESAPFQLKLFSYYGIGSWPLRLCGVASQRQDPPQSS